MTIPVVKDIEVRPALEADLPAIREIYNAAVATTTASWDLAPETAQTRLDWWRQRTAGGWPVLVAETTGDGAGQVVGWATMGPFRPKAGYAATAEHTIYVRDGHRGLGIGRTLLGAIVDQARDRGLHALVGGLDATNAASLHFHRALGFEVVGTLPEVGRKFDRWLDLTFCVLLLDEVDTGQPGPA